MCGQYIHVPIPECISAPYYYISSTYIYMTSEVRTAFEILFLCLCNWLTIFMLTSRVVHTSACLSVCQPFCTCPSICLPVCQPVSSCACVCLHVCLSVSLSLPVLLSVRLLACLSACLFLCLCLSACLPVCQPVSSCPSVCLPASVVIP